MAKPIITKYSSTGICEVDMYQAIRQWDDNFFITQWREEYTLHRRSRRCPFKCHISKIQAKELISDMGLIVVKDPLFVSATGYFTRGHANQQIETLKETEKKLTSQLHIIHDQLLSYQAAVALKVVIDRGTITR